MRLIFRFSLAFLLAAVSGAVSAIGLGDLRAQPSLGDRFSLAVDLLGVKNSPPDASCFRLVRPSQGDSLPWLRDAELRVVSSGRQPVLEIRSTRVLREPLMQLAIQVACGYEVQREYTLLASPRGDLSPEAPLSNATVVTANRAARHDVQKHRAGGSSGSSANAPRKTPVPVSEVSTGSTSKNDPADRLMLSGASDAELSLRLEKLFEQQLIAGEQDEKRRELLRKEFRLLMALQENAGSDAQTIEKLRNMEVALLELRQSLQALSDASVPPSPTPSTEASVTPPADVSLQALPQVRPDVQAVASIEESSVSDWMLYGLLIGVVLGIAGWLLWGAYRDQMARRLLAENAPVNLKSVANLPPVDDPWDENEKRIPPPVSPLDVNSVASPLVLTTPHDEVAVQSVVAAPSAPQGRSDDVSTSVSGLVLDDHHDVSPVMELAEIMLSFGRVKGAAQALQEYVDNNPQEALQPWIRLMDVYRMAGMREEFERVARNLHQNFNVEIQSWDMTKATESVGLVVAAESGAINGEPNAVSAVQSVEEMPGIISSVIRMWDEDDVVGYLYQLLRDNRGGLRQGFPMLVVEEILFLIELKETANRMGKETALRG